MIKECFAYYPIHTLYITFDFTNDRDVIVHSQHAEPLSILASLGGTPCIMMNSNSHKSMAIYEELEYDNKALYSNLSSDDEIAEILAQVDNSIKHVDRANIINKIMIKKRTTQDVRKVAAITKNFQYEA